MLMQSNTMLSIKYIAVQNSPSYRLYRPAKVSSKQDSGRAGPETGRVRCKTQSMILSSMLIQSYNMLPIYKISSCVELTQLQAVQTSSGEQQTRLRQSRTLQNWTRTRPLQKCCLNTNIGFCYNRYINQSCAVNFLDRIGQPNRTEIGNLSKYSSYRIA